MMQVLEKVISPVTKPMANQNRNINLLGWMIWTCAGLFYLYELILRVSPSVMAHGLMDSFDITASSLGILGSFYYIAYVILQVPCGVLVDKLGPRLIITMSCVLCAFGAWLFAESHTLWAAKIARLLIGMGSACAFISCLKLATEWFHPNKFAVMAGFTNMLGTLGGIFGGPPMAVFVNNVGWRQATHISAYVGVFLIAVCWLVIKNKPKVPIHPHKLDHTSLSKSIRILIRDKQVLLAGLVGGLMYLPVSVFAELWAVPFLMNSLNINNELASTISSMVFIGMAIGSPIMAKWATYLNSMIKVMSYSAIMSTLLLVAITYVRYLPIWAGFVLCFLLGIIIGGQVLCFSLVKVRAPHQISGTAMAFTNALVMLSAMIFQPVLGFILDLNWNGQTDLVGVRVYTASSYQIAILCLPICFLASWGLLKFYKEPKVKVT